MELLDLEKQKAEETHKREIIEHEKIKLIREHEEILKSFYKKGYDKSVNSLSSNHNWSFIITSKLTYPLISF